MLKQPKLIYKEVKKELDSYCPICLLKVKKPNNWVNYHIRYDPPLVIKACKFCNFTEFALRNKLNVSYNKYTLKRIPYVVAYQKKFGIQL